MVKRIGLAAFVAVGVLLIVWGVLSFTSPSVSCRGVEMGPGDECSYFSRTSTETRQTQTYEQRVDAARRGAPTVIGLGIATSAFGVWVALRSGPRAQASSDIGP